MKIGELCTVGVVRNDESDFVPLFGVKTSYGKYQVFFDNGTFGQVEAAGMGDLELVEVSENGEAELISLLESGVRGDYTGAIMLEGSIAFIKDLDFFDLVISSKISGEKADENYQGFIDVGELDFDECEYAEELMARMNLM